MYTYENLLKSQFNSNLVKRLLKQDAFDAAAIILVQSFKFSTWGPAKHLFWENCHTLAARDHKLHPDAIKELQEMLDVFSKAVVPYTRKSLEAAEFVPEVAQFLIEGNFNDPAHMLETAFIWDKFGQKKYEFWIQQHDYCSDTAHVSSPAIKELELMIKAWCYA